jgi:acyl-CoA thioester hydrolase
MPFGCLFPEPDRTPVFATVDLDCDQTHFASRSDESFLAGAVEASYDRGRNSSRKLSIGSNLMDFEVKAKSLLAKFPVVITLPVQWGDQDLFCHVNNTVYFRWFESARIAYCDRIGLSHLLDVEPIAPILASISCDYRRQITFPDTVHVGTRVTRIGRSSMELEHTIVSQGRAVIAAEGSSTIVVFDYRANKSQPVPLTIRQTIEALEGRSFS